MSKRLFFTILVSAFFVLFLCSFTETDDFFVYEINEKDEAEIISYKGTLFSENAIIPEEIEGHPVTKIQKNAFIYNKYLESVTIPESVTVIDESAFAYCSVLRRVEFVSSSEIELPELKINHSAFERCELMTELIFPDNRRVFIDDFAFEGCIRLNELSFTQEVYHIGYMAFSGCEKLYFKTNGNPEAEKYAQENGIPTSFFETEEFKMICVSAASIICLSAIFIGYSIIKKRKNKI